MIASHISILMWLNTVKYKIKQVYKLTFDANTDSSGREPRNRKEDKAFNNACPAKMLANKRTPKVTARME